MPFASDVVVTVNCADAIVMLIGLVAVAVELSVTCTVKFAVAAVVGVPLITPAALRDSPRGSDPLVTLQALLPLPPLAASVCEYAVPTVPFASDVVVTVNCADAIVMLIGLVAVALELSVTCTVKFAVAAV